MGKFRRLIAVGVILPLVAFASSLGASSAPAGAHAAGMVAPDVASEVGAGDSYQCCWVFLGGRWWCIPC
jgi:hypothetical protein